MQIWNIGDTCYFSGVKGFGKGVIQGIIEEIDGSDVLVHVPNGYESPWLKKLSDLFDTEAEAKEMVDIEISEMPSILDIVSVQPMMAPTPGTIPIRYTYATNSTQQPVNQLPTAGGNGNEDSVSTGQSQEEGDTGGIQGHNQVPPLHLQPVSGISSFIKEYQKEQ